MLFVAVYVCLHHGFCSAWCKRQNCGCRYRRVFGRRECYGKNESSVGTISDLDGNYSLVVSKTATLVFSYIGYISQEVPVGEKNMINVSLVEDSKTLSEVVVIGYGTMKNQI